uniref:beta-1,3-galactosyltransferase 1-like isoform X1 n=1 Tax=Styela clava TaxID=7725 RepID=UPI00193AC1F7|nr:beta-1,3-galactosyltransferase 1-like isoform X1 [Styela clava]
MALKKVRLLVLVLTVFSIFIFIQMFMGDKGPVIIESSSIFVNDKEENSEIDEGHENGKKQIVSLLPKKNILEVVRQNNSVIPEKFFEKKLNISPHEFGYLLNPTRFCGENIHNDQSKQVFFLVMIASASWEFERRDLIRRTWASMTNVSQKSIKYLFFVGNDNESNSKLKLEYVKFGDIVQEDYQETYRNLTLKTQGQLKWLKLYCPNATFYMHVDDDVMPHIDSIVKQHLDILPNSREMGCAKVFQPKVRREGKWVTSLEEYSGDQYPLSCVGWCFIMPAVIAFELYYMSLNTHLLHLEDVWTTGILREKIGNVKIRKMENDLGKSVCEHLGWPKDEPTNEKILTAWRKLQNEN